MLQTLTPSHWQLSAVVVSRTYVFGPSGRRSASATKTHGGVRQAHCGAGEVWTNGTLPVSLVARTNALGLLQISCVSAAPGSQQSWPLEFNMRLHDQGRASVPGARQFREATAQIEPNVAADALETARKQIGMALAQPDRKSKKGKVTAGTILKSLERILGSPRSGWNGPLSRALWPALEEQLDSRRLSVDHEEAHHRRIPAAPGLRSCPGRPSYRRPVAPARRRPMFSRSVHQEPGIHPMAASGRRTNARTPEQASDRRG